MKLRLLKILLVGYLVIPAYSQSGTRAWYQVLEVKGTATKQTDLFETKGTKWRVRWEKTKPEDHLSVYVYDKDGKPITAIQTQSATRDESYIHKPGKYYLAIGATTTYSITVEDWR